MRIATKLLLLVLALALRPIATGQAADGPPLLSSTPNSSARHTPLGGLAQPFVLRVGHPGHIDGMNLYLYLLANPITMLDWSGLNSLGYDVDDLIWALTGGRAATAHHVAQTVAITVLQTSLAAMVPAFGLY